MMIELKITTEPLVSIFRALYENGYQSIRASTGESAGKREIVFEFENKNGGRISVAVHE